MQGELTRALSLIEGHDVIVHCSGRTDAGVHARGQVANVTLQREISPHKLRAAINGNVSKDLRIMDAEIVADDFHARYSALEKTYCYRVVNQKVISPFLLRYAHHDARPLNLGQMRESASLFQGEHDWNAFSSAQSDAESKVRRITRCEVAETVSECAGQRIVEISVSAEGFLRYMVRSIAGTLLAAGRGEMDARLVQLAIDTGDRATVGATAPACGLTLESVRYE